MAIPHILRFLLLLRIIRNDWFLAVLYAIWGNADLRETLPT